MCTPSLKTPFVVTILAHQHVGPFSWIFWLSLSQVTKHAFSGAFQAPTLYFGSSFQGPWSPF